MPDLPAPVHVSPLIKFFRYAFLIAGIFYGAGKLKALRALEESRTEEKARKQAEKTARLAEEKQLAAERDFEQIVEIFRPPPRVGHVDQVMAIAAGGLEPPCDRDFEPHYGSDILENPLDLREREDGEEPEDYVIKDFGNIPILPPEDKDCRIPPKV